VAKNNSPRRVDDDEMPAEFDFTRLGPGVRGKHYARLMAKSDIVRIAPDVHEAFPNEDAVNSALRGLIAKRKPKRAKTGGAKRAAR
jgi:hypothetical protein